MTPSQRPHDDLRQACRDPGLPEATTDALRTHLLQGDAAVSPPGDELRQAHDRMARREAEIMELLKTSSPDRIIHDLRNVLNEVTLLKAAAGL